MEVSSSLSALNAFKTQGPQRQDQTRAATAPSSGVEGRDKESDGDSDDGTVTAQRGQKLNIKA